MRKLGELVVTISDLRDCINSATDDSEPNEKEGHQTAYQRARKRTSLALESGGGKLIQVMQRASESSRLKESRLPIHSLVVSNLAKLEKRYDHMMKQRAADDALDLSDLELRLYDLIAEKSSLISLPQEEPCFDDHDAATESNCRGCVVWYRYYKNMSERLQEIEIRNAGVFSTYNPLTTSTSVVEVEKASLSDWTNESLHPVGLIIETRALNWLVDNNMSKPLKNVLGNIIVTKWY